MIVYILFCSLAFVALFLAIWNYFRINSIIKQIDEFNTKYTFSKELLIEIDDKLTTQEVNEYLKEALNVDEAKDIDIDELTENLKTYIEKNKNNRNHLA